MEKEYNRKRLYPMPWQHDYHVLTRLRNLITKFINKTSKNKRYVFLDYGCGTAPYKDLLVQITSEYVGIDIVKSPTAQFVVPEKTKIPFKAESFDIVLSTQVLEHVEDTQFYLSECNRLLKKKGLLLLSTHGIWPYHPFPHDYHRWTAEGLINELKKQNFICVSITPILGSYAAMIQFELLLMAESLIKKGLGASILLKFLSTAGNGVIWVYDRLFPPTQKSDAAVYFLVAQKE